MKKYLIILTVFLGSFAVAKAQDEKQPGKPVEALYVAYVTQQLQLSPEDAQKFWPIHA